MAEEQQVEATEVVTPEVVVDETPESDPLLDVLTDTEDKSEAKADEEVVETEDKEVTDEETTPEDENKPEETEELDPKEEARKRYEERQTVIAERKARVEKQTQDYINETDDATEQRLRTIEAQEYSRIIEHTENTLVGEYERAVAKLDIFNPESDSFNKPLLDYAIEQFNAGYVQYDENKNMIGLKGSIEEHLTKTAELYKGAVKSGQIKQVRDGKKMKVNSDSKPAATPKETQKDTISDILMSD